MTNKDPELLPRLWRLHERGLSYASDTPAVNLLLADMAEGVKLAAEAIAAWNTRTALLPCQVSDAMRRLEKFHDTLNVNRHYMTGQTCREIQRDIRIALDALTTASTIPTDAVFAGAIRTLEQHFYTDEELSRWLVAPHPQFDGLSALQMLAAGRKAEVLACVQRLDDGVYR